MNNKQIRAKLNRMLNKLCGMAAMSCGYEENLAKEFAYQDKLVAFIMSEIEKRGDAPHRD